MNTKAHIGAENQEDEPASGVHRLPVTEDEIDVIVGSVYGRERHGHAALALNVMHYAAKDLHFLAEALSAGAGSNLEDVAEALIRVSRRLEGVAEMVSERICEGGR